MEKVTKNGSTDNLKKIDHRDLKCIGEMESFPNDILRVIFCLLDDQEFMLFRFVCKRFWQLSKTVSPAFWKMKIIESFGEKLIKFIGDTPLSLQLYMSQKKRLNIFRHCIKDGVSREHRDVYFHFKETECRIRTFKGTIYYDKIKDITVILADSSSPNSFGSSDCYVCRYKADGDVFKLFSYVTGKGDDRLLSFTYLKELISQLNEKGQIRPTADRLGNYSDSE